MEVSYLSSSNGVRLAYTHIDAQGGGGALPAVMFLGGFKSDMTGTKAMYLEKQCRKCGQEFVRFDYSGHGQSGGKFINGTIGSWKNDALDILNNIVTRDVILVGSSMGGWISLLLLRENNARIKGVVGIAAAPDFTKDIEARMSVADNKMMADLGRLEISNDYSDEPYIFTKKLLEDGRAHSVLDTISSVSVPIALIQGKKDNDVPWVKAIKIKECFKGDAVKIIFVDDGDHRLSRDNDLNLLGKQVSELSRL